MTDEMKKYFAELLEYAINQYMSLGLPHIITEKDNPHSAIYLYSWNPTDDPYYWDILMELSGEQMNLLHDSLGVFPVSWNSVNISIYYNDNREKVLTAVYETREK